MLVTRVRLPACALATRRFSIGEAEKESALLMLQEQGLASRGGRGKDGSGLGGKVDDGKESGEGKEQNVTVLQQIEHVEACHMMSNSSFFAICALTLSAIPRSTSIRSACSVAASYKPPMLVTRVRLPACALAATKFSVRGADKTRQLLMVQEQGWPGGGRGGHGEGWKWAGRGEDDGKESGEGKEQRARVLQQIKPV